MTDKDLPETLLSQLTALPLVSGRPLVAVDVDEVLVVFVDHLARFIGTLGYRMQLDSYQLEGSIFPVDSEQPVPFDGCIDLINRFFAEKVEAQEPVPGGLEALTKLSEIAQIIILTNVPAHGGPGRRRNLDALGLCWPMIVNQGGKGRAMAWLARRVEAPVVIVDDSVTQIQSVARHVPDAIRVHFAEAPMIQRLFPVCPQASCQARSWPQAVHEITERISQKSA